MEDVWIAIKMQRKSSEHNELKLLNMFFGSLSFSISLVSSLTKVVIPKPLIYVVVSQDFYFVWKFMKLVFVLAIISCMCMGLAFKWIRVSKGLLLGKFPLRLYPLTQMSQLITSCNLEGMTSLSFHSVCSP